MKESDWKVFKEIKQKTIEKYCTSTLQEFKDIIDDDKEHVYNRYLILYKLVQDKDKEMGILFDDHSRTSAPLQLLHIRGNGLADNQLLENLSAEFFQKTDPEIRRMIERKLAIFLTPVKFFIFKQNRNRRIRSKHEKRICQK